MNEFGLFEMLMSRFSLEHLLASRPRTRLNHWMQIAGSGLKTMGPGESRAKQSTIWVPS